MLKNKRNLLMILLSSLIMASPACATVDTGDTAWLMTSTMLVLMMIPGLAFFYAGLVARKNVVSTLYQNIIPLGVVGVLWVLVGFSLAFSGGNAFIGDLNLMMFSGVTGEPDGTATIPYILFAMFQMMFAIITPALMSGAVAGRIKFSAWLMIVPLWSLIVYTPVAHWVWGSTGWLFNMGALDFAGGYVVHITAGFSALVLAALMGHGENFGKAHKPYNIGMVLLGTALLFCGWFGFNAGSALTSGGLASVALSNTFIAAVVTMLVWTYIDAVTDGKPTLVGACVGIVAGLVVITPAAGYVTAGSAVLLGLSSAIICNLTARFVKNKLKIDDTLDVFACHGISGVVGSVLTGVFATNAVNPAVTNNGLLMGGGTDLFFTNITATVSVALYAAIATFIIFKIVNAICPVRVSAEDEKKGLDISQHNEEIS
jgi:ammonium transporter, Amt family